MKYYVDDHQDIEDAITFKSSYGPETPKYAAEDAAKNYHDNHDGWEDTWPLVFVILDDELNELGRFSVDREAVPQFWASSI